MTSILEELNLEIENLSLETVMLDADDISGLGKAIKSIESILELSKPLKESALTSITEAMKQYVEEAILGERKDLGPFERGISTLQEMVRDIAKGKKINGDTAALIANPDSNPSDSSESTEDSATLIGGPSAGAGDSATKMSQEDREIISDFVAESLENLGTIEVRLIDLEQDPTDIETINAIFRPFHTVKGVSGFLNFNKINKFAHIVENLLDKARNGELRIDGEIVDVILESVDLLKGMIGSVRDSLDTGKPFEGDEDISQIKLKIEQLISSPVQGEGKRLLGEMLVASGTVTDADIKEALDVQQKEPDKKIGEILVEQEKIKTKAVVSTLREQKRTDSTVDMLQVKVDTTKLDSIVDMVGELAIAQSMLRQHEVVVNSKDRKLDQITNQLNLITSGLQNIAMSMRMVPIKNTFQKMLRLVRDLAKKADKDIQLVMSGEDTEIDRNIMEEIYEPMVHMIRNSVDHGLELPDEREAKNKPRQGTIHLKAYHRGGNIVIEIMDDGRGLNREKILKKAVSTGLIKQEDKLSDAEIDNLIFHPGFSTAEKVTDISGRGVGTDVVKSKIEKLRGRVEVRSVTGKGSTFFMRLPLTLAIVDGMIVKVANERYIIPTLNIQESFRPKEDEYFTVKGEGEMIRVRNTLIPLVRLERLFGLNGCGSSDQTRVAPWEKLVVVVENQEKKICLLVDELIGQEEIVIKSLGGWLKGIKGVAGSVIMGDGRVGLILDIGSIFQMV
ncbi:MAG: chemotaxis protein CheA [Proteobacteria bacterium]|nr:chemotaxis protein CheA [Pseudomonadota bacterium]